MNLDGEVPAIVADAGGSDAATATPGARRSMVPSIVRDIAEPLAVTGDGR